MKKTDSLHNILHSLPNENKFFHTEKKIPKKLKIEFDIKPHSTGHSLKTGVEI